MKIITRQAILYFILAILCLHTGSPVVNAETGRDGQRMFPTAEEALAELRAALRSQDNERLTQMFGKNSRDFFSTGDPVGDAIAMRRMSARLDERAELFPVVSAEFRDEQWYLIRYGIEGWNMHVPLVHRGKGWSFATEYASEMDVKRRRSLNEVATVDTLRALVAAQHQYKKMDRNGDGVLEFAKRFGSSPGTRDGLYWPSEPGTESSPIDGIILKALQDGYQRDGKNAPTYYGYTYRILTAQGGNTRGGKRSYLKDDRLIDGFAILAYPVQWQASGDATFLVGSDAQVWKKDLGFRTEKIASDIESMDLDQTWVRVDPNLGGKNSRTNW